jgi:drug/metabolite transporter (DMT)-like permease
VDRGVLTGSLGEPFLIERNGMWKIAVGFAVFAGLALFILSKGGDIDMSGEKHGAEATHVEPAKAASAPDMAASAVPAATASAPK